MRRLLYGVCIIGLYFFVGFRYEVGCDWSGYENIFELQRYESIGDSLGKSEPAFWAANALLHYYGLEYPYINVIASGAFFLGFHALARRQPDRLGILILAFPVLIINLAMSGIRQAIALGIMCVAFNAFTDKRLVRYVLWVMVAATFHSSALSFLTFAPFVHGSLSNRSIFLAGILLVPGAYFLLQGDAFQVYSSRYVATGADATGAPFRTGLLALTSLVFLLFLNKKWGVCCFDDQKFITISSWLMIMVFPLAFLSPVIGDRFGYYLNPVQLIVLTRLAVFFRHRNLIAIAPYVVQGLVLSVWTQYSDLFAICYLPYKFWW